MPKPSIRIKFVDYYNGCNSVNESLYKLLLPYYDVQLVDNPDYIFVGGMGHDHLKYDCIKIFETGENFVPDFNLFDYAFGHQYINFGDRYMRRPHYCVYPEFKRLGNDAQMPDQALLNRGFCSFVVSNAAADPFRDEFYRELSKYKPISSGGRHLNNVGGPVADKLEFVSKYKFNIAIENSEAPGYVTEKIMQPLSVHSVPIYFGDPLVDRDFNPEAFVWIRSREDIKRAVEEIAYLDTHNDGYLKRCRANPLRSGTPDDFDTKTVAFLRHIFDQPLAKARRTVLYGYQVNLRNEIKRLYGFGDIINRAEDFIKTPVRFVKRHLHKNTGGAS